jgi:hypothetical protein
MEDGVDGAGVEMNVAVTDEAIIDHLGHGPLHRFADWPNRDLPKVAIGLYTVWRGDEFIYVGMAGRSTPSKLSERQAGGSTSGLRSRLRSHASGRRSGDQFCVYVADKILAAAGHPVSDDFVRDYVCQHLSYRFYAFESLTHEDQATARRVERTIQSGATPLGLPLLNPAQPLRKRR